MEATAKDKMNYQTQIVLIYLNNDRRENEELLAMTKESLSLAKPTDVFTAEETVRIRLADYIKAMFDNGTTDTLTDPFGTLLNSAIQAVNWQTVARDYIERVKEEL
jgi:hypothetical protein